MAISLHARLAQPSEPQHCNVYLCRSNDPCEDRAIPYVNGSTTSRRGNVRARNICPRCGATNNALTAGGGVWGGAAARANWLSTDSLSAQPWWHGAGPPCCCVADEPSRSMLCAVMVPSLRLGTGIALT